MLSQRQQYILKLIIEDYIRSAEPIGSKLLAEKFHLGVSSATVRNEMAELERQGYLDQPHTSAGRIPTEKAYIFYIQNLQEQQVVQGRPLEEFENTHERYENSIKGIAKRLVEVSGETAIIAFDPNWSYYTGVSNLLHKPDFRNLEMTRTISDLIDQFDEVIHRMFGTVPEEPHIYLGMNNPFGREMATILVRYKDKNEHTGLIGLVGPLRMNYPKNIALVERARDVIAEL